MCQRHSTALCDEPIALPQSYTRACQQLIEAKQSCIGYTSPTVSVRWYPDIPPSIPSLRLCLESVDHKHRLTCFYHNSSNSSEGPPVHPSRNPSFFCAASRSSGYSPDASGVAGAFFVCSLSLSLRFLHRHMQHHDWSLPWPTHLSFPLWAWFAF